MIWVFFLSAIVCGLLTMVVPKRDQNRTHLVMWAFFFFTWFMYIGAL